MALTPRVFITADQIQRRVDEMADLISADYPEGPLYLIGILKGSFIFLADLARAIRTPTRIEFIGIASYGGGTTTSGEVRLTKDLDVSLEGHHAILVEDIVDSGITLSYLQGLVERRRPKSLKIATLLDKPSRRLRPVRVDYTGFVIPDRFVVGYGLDADQNYRSLPDVCFLEETSSDGA